MADRTCSNCGCDAKNVVWNDIGILEHREYVYVEEATYFDKCTNDYDLDLVRNKVADDHDVDAADVRLYTRDICISGDINETAINRILMDHNIMDEEELGPHCMDCGIMIED